MNEKRIPTAHEIAYGEVEIVPLSADEVVAENPGDLDLFEVVEVEGVGDEDDLAQVAEDFLSNNETRLAKAKELGESIVLKLGKHKKIWAFIGVGVTVAVGGYVAFRYVRPRPSKDKE